MYKLKLCNSTHKYMESRSALDINKVAPLTANNTINPYFSPIPFYF